MGTSPPRPGSFSPLFPAVQARLIGLLFGQPDRRFQSAELIRIAQSGTGATHRQLQQMAAAGLLAVTRVGNQKFYQANHASPIFEELHSIALKTVGLEEPLRVAIAPFGRRIRAAFVYGSVARGTEGAGSDVDLMILSDTVSYAELFDALREVEQQLARPVNPTLMTPVEWQSQRLDPESFVARIAGGSKRFIVGEEGDISRA